MLMHTKRNICAITKRGSSLRKFLTCNGFSDCTFILMMPLHYLLDVKINDKTEIGSFFNLNDNFFPY